MSLINQMLKELDARHSDTKSQEGLQATPIRSVAQRRSVQPMGIAAVVAAFGLAGGAAWWWLSGAATSQATSTPAAATAAALEKSPASMTMVDAAAPASPGQAYEETVTAMASEEAPQVAAMTAVSAPASQSVVVEEPVLAAAPTAPKEHAVKPVKAATAAPQAVAAAVAPSANETASNAPPKASAAVLAAPQAGQGTKETVKQVRELTVAQRAENEFRRATQALQQGRTTEALTLLDQTLRLDARHSAARQTRIAVLLDMRRGDEALNQAREGVALNPHDANLAMILARLQVDRQELHAAIATLEQTLSHALDRPDYLAFLAALLQRDAQHKQAVDYYLQALRQAPHNGVWWMGMGISLQAEQRHREAQEAFMRAKHSATLSQELLAFVEQRLAQLRQM